MRVKKKRKGIDLIWVNMGRREWEDREGEDGGRWRPGEDS